jgi:hypothetical protein
MWGCARGVLAPTNLHKEYARAVLMLSSPLAFGAVLAAATINLATFRITSFSAILESMIIVSPDS